MENTICLSDISMNVCVYTYTQVYGNFLTSPIFSTHTHTYTHVVTSFPYSYLTGSQSGKESQTSLQMSSPAPILFSIYNWMAQLTQETIITQVPTSSKHTMEYEKTRNDHFYERRFHLSLFPLLLLSGGYSME